MAKVALLCDSILPSRTLVYGSGLRFLSPVLGRLSDPEKASGQGLQIGDADARPNIRPGFMVNAYLAQTRSHDLSALNLLLSPLMVRLRSKTANNPPRLAAQKISANPVGVGVRAALTA